METYGNRYARCTHITEVHSGTMYTFLIDGILFRGCDRCVPAGPPPHVLAIENFAKRPEKKEE